MPVQYAAKSTCLSNKLRGQLAVIQLKITNSTLAKCFSINVYLLKTHGYSSDRHS